MTAIEMVVFLPPFSGTNRSSWAATDQYRSRDPTHSDDDHSSGRAIGPIATSVTIETKKHTDRTAVVRSGVQWGAMATIDDCPSRFQRQRITNYASVSQHRGGAERIDGEVIVSGSAEPRW